MTTITFTWPWSNIHKHLVTTFYLVICHEHIGEISNCEILQINRARDCNTTQQLMGRAKYAKNSKLLSLKSFIIKTMAIWRDSRAVDYQDEGCHWRVKGEHKSDVSCGIKDWKVYRWITLLQGKCNYLLAFKKQPAFIAMSRIVVPGSINSLVDVAERKTVSNSSLVMSTRSSGRLPYRTLVARLAVSKPVSVRIMGKNPIRRCKIDNNWSEI